MKRIIFTRPDGGVSVTTPVINTYPVREEITEEEAIARALAKMPEGASNIQVVDATAIPTDRTFRNAWMQDGATVVHDMAKCRELQKERMRLARAPKLQCLDAEYMKALESGDKYAQAEIASQKQALRDVTNDPAIESAASPEELKSTWPTILR